jgi:hypothetical protein
MASYLPFSPDSWSRDASMGANGADGSFTVRLVLDHDEIVRLYGPWRPRTPEDAAALFDGYGGVGWIAGGWAIEAFTHVHRPHDDIDPSVPRSDIPTLRAHLSGRFDIWEANDGTLRPLVSQADVVSETCDDLWLRPSGADPWEYDVKLMHATSTTWTYKRDPRVTLPLPEILWSRDGIPYLRPEVQLLHKARGLRPKDQSDFDACLPLLDPEPRAWLREALDLAHPDHPWLRVL